MQTLQREGIASESNVALPTEPAESTSTNCYNFSSNIPNLPRQRKGSHYKSSQCTPYVLPHVYPRHAHVSTIINSCSL